jgi:enolase-phosphatase E1
MIRAILTDIEGTTSSVSFVKDVLFPYAREHMADFVRAHGEEVEVRKLLDEVGRVCGAHFDDEQAIAQLVRWIDEDRKVTPLKSLQGLIWEAGYRNGDYRGHVYPDAVHKLREWEKRGMALYVFSSGSVHAQKLLFRHTEYGDLTPLFSGYFDTQVGAKQEADSYRRIAETIGLAPANILFLSDIEAELDAAREAGLKTCLLVRDDAIADGGTHPQARNFDAISVAA